MEKIQAEIQFKLEEQIMDCWGIVEDLKTVYYSEDLYLDQDEMMNVLLGLISLYNIKFENLFTTFGVLLKEFYEMKQCKGSIDQEK